MYKAIEAALINGEIKFLEKQPLPRNARLLIIFFRRRRADRLSFM